MRQGGELTSSSMASCNLPSQEKNIKYVSIDVIRFMVHSHETHASEVNRLCWLLSYLVPEVSGHNKLVKAICTICAFSYKLQAFKLEAAAMYMYKLSWMVSVKEV